MIKTLKIGDIGASRFYIGLEIKPYPADRFRAWWGPTYYGTVRGLVVI